MSDDPFGQGGPFVQGGPFGQGGPEALGNRLAGMQEMAAGFATEIAAASRALREMDGSALKLSRSLSSSLRSAFEKAVFGGEKLTDVFRDLAASVAGRVLNAAIKPVTSSLSQGFTGLFGGLTGAIGSAFGFADGAAFSAGRVRAFAQGGVVGGPTLFPMRGGVGLMGEAGPEAVMPLTRGADGRLGVAMQGGQGARPVIVNIRTPDIEGFRASRGQVSAQLARAVRRGQGRL